MCICFIMLLSKHNHVLSSLKCLVKQCLFSVWRTHTGITPKVLKYIGEYKALEATAVAEWLTYLTCNPDVPGSSPDAGMKVTGATPLSKVY